MAALLVVTPAAAQSVTSDRLDRFVKASQSRVGPADWQDLLYEIAKSERVPETVTASFAKLTGVSRASALTYAAVIIESAIGDGTCEEKPSVKCPFAPGQPHYERAAAAGLADRTGNLLIVVGRSKAFTLNDAASFFALARKHRAASTIFKHMYEVTDHPAYLLATLQLGRFTDRVAMLAASHDEAWWLRGDAALQLAMLELLEQSAITHKASMDVRAALAQLSLSLKLEFRLLDAAIESYYAYPGAIRSRLPVALTTCRQCAPLAKAGYALSDELAAALWAAGHKGDARRLLPRQHSGLGPRARDDLPRYLALSDAVAPLFRTADLYSLYINGHVWGDGRRRSKILSRLPLFRDGWLFNVRNSGLGVRRVVASRLRAAGHGDMAQYLEEAILIPEASFRDPLLEAAAAMFPAAVRDRQAFWSARLEKVRAPRRAVTDGPVRITVRDLPAWWTERPLPDSVKAWHDTDPVQTPPRDAGLPVDRDAVLRYEARNGERAIVYLSSEYDPSDDVPGAGMWFARTVGGRWAAPLYLGLQQRFPYIATRGSKLPLLEGNRLRLEVRVRKIDSLRIAFPLISLDLKRSADGLYLDFDLTVLAADRDSDGLTDIEERRVGLDFTNPDTDGDGVPDGLDPLPLVAYRTTAALRGRAASAIVAAIFGHSPAPIIVPIGNAPTIDNMVIGDPSARAASQRTRTRFLIADPSMFAHVATPFRLIVYAPQDIGAMGRGAAPFYPPQAHRLFSSLDGTQHYVEWPVGGSFILTCGAAPDAGCTAKTRRERGVS